MAKHITLTNVAGVVQFDADVEAVIFKNNWIEVYAPDWFGAGVESYLHFSGGFIEKTTNEPLYFKAVIGPIGLAYPGDATDGTGGKTIIVAWRAGGGVIHHKCDNVDFDADWIQIVKGDFVIAYSSICVYQCNTSL
jgi:hypothetical protein